jgi:soluble P-type ATPase
MPVGVLEQAGAGIGGEVDGHAVRLGNEGWTAPAPGDSPRRFQRRAVRHEGSVIFVSIDGCLAGAFLFDDPIRPDAPRVLRLLKRRGITETIMLTGDHAAVAESVGAAIGVDRVLAGVTPEEKLNAVAESCRERVTLMIGDGINDAPALATADVGIAMGARGATSTSETADVVLVVDRLDRLLEALDIAHRSRRIAVQSMVAGMALSFVAMGFATFGLLTPVAGAVLQEAIDAAAILNALRALTGGPRRRGQALPQDMAESLRAEHRGLIPQVQSLADLADSLHELSPDALLCQLRETRSLVDAMVAHERRDERQMYPRLARGLDGDDPLAAMSRTHQEIFHLARTFDRLALSFDGDPAEAEDLVDLRRTLYALSAVLRLNIAQEEELFVMLDPDTTGTHVSAA